MSKKNCVKICEHCGKEFQAESGYEKYCPDCKPIMAKIVKEKFAQKKFMKHQEELKKNGVEGYDYVVDRWNNLLTPRIPGQWMKTYHPDRTIEEYISEFPDAQLVCRKTSEKISANTKESMNRPEMKKLFSEKMKGDNNPNAKCNTTLEQRQSISPFSKSFKKYEGMSDEEVNNSIKQYRHDDDDSKTTCQVGYWIKKGFTEEEAKELVSERQRTFTLEKCIEKYGEEKGTDVWNKRQSKWIKSLQHSFILDGDNRTPISSFENNCKTEICKALNIDIPKKQKYISDKNGNHYSFDLTIEKKIIEFNGDYWHMNPKLYNESSFNKTKKMTALDIWSHDKSKIQCAKDNGYDVLVIWESEYNKDKDGTIKKCIEFLTRKQI